MKQIKDFRVQIISLNPKGHTSILSMKESVDIQRLNQRVTTITFLGSNDISLDGRPLTEASKVAFNLGQSVYPLSFQMNEEDYELLNFDAAKAQWDKYSKVACSGEESKYVKEYIESSSLWMKDESTFLKAIMQRIFLQLMLFKDNQDYLMIPNYPNPNTPLQWKLKRTSSYFNPSIWDLKAQLPGSNPYFVEGKGILEVEKTNHGIPKDIHLEFRVEMSNEGYYRKMVDINIIEE